MDSEPRFAEKRKAIRDKKERFLERKGEQEIVVPVVESASGADQERPAYSESVTGVRVKRRWETVALRSLTHRREERTRQGMLTRVARPFGAPSTGFPADFGPWIAVHFGACEDHSVGKCSHLGVTQVQALGSHLALLAWQEIFLEETAMSKKRSRRTASPDG